MEWIWFTFVYFFPNILQSSSIQTRYHRPIRFADQRPSPTRHFRHIDSVSTHEANFDWEYGLREATVQTLFREHYGDASLRKHIHAAPLLGKQNKASPFGDIAILAQGQLYANYAGLIFVQDPYQNDCEDCHNVGRTVGRCIGNHCQIWRPSTNEKLIALWTIRRIRHRSSRDSPQYELEFTISPVGLRYQNGPYLTKEGTFNYNLPGHIFVLKSAETHQGLKSAQHIHHLKKGAFIAQTQDGRKFILHSFPGLSTPENHGYYELPPKYPLLHTPVLTSTPSTSEYSEEDEKKIYQTLLDVLHKKTSPESTRFTPTPKSTTTLSDTTQVQLPGGQIIPIAELETPFITKTTPGYVTVRFPDSTEIHETSAGRKTTATVQETTFTTTLPSRVTPQIYGMIRPQMSFHSTKQTTATYHTTTPVRTENEGQVIFPETTPSSTVAYTKPKPFYTTPNLGQDEQRPQSLGTTQKITTVYTTNPPVKMTFHFFAAEEEKKTTANLYEKPATTAQQLTYTEYKDILSDTKAPTQPTPSYVSDITIVEPKTTTKQTSPTISSSKQSTNYPTTSITRQMFSSRIPTTEYKPTAIMRVTRPTEEATTSYSSTFFDVTEHSTRTPSTGSSTTFRQPESTFKIPITVLDDYSPGSTREQQSGYPTTPATPATHFEQAFTVTQAPSTTYVEPTLSIGTTKYTTVEFSYSTPSLRPTTFTDQSSTLPQTTFTNPSNERPTTSSREPTLTSENAIETTLGVTKFMGTAQNKTTEMVYYAAQETETPFVKTTQPIVVTTFSVTTPRYTETTTKQKTTPKRIVTSIKADGTVSVKTTPLSLDEELFGPTKSTPKKAIGRFTSTTPSGPDDFLIDDSSLQKYPVPLYKKPLKDYDDDDIFGSTKRTFTTKPTEQATKPYSKSDIEEALFDVDRRKSRANIRQRLGTTEPTPRVIYSDFFEASTIPMTAEATSTTIGSVKMARIYKVTRPPRKSFSLAKRKKFGAVTSESTPLATTMSVIEQVTPVTSQSYLTSISYEVNKRKIVFGDHSKPRTIKKESDPSINTQPGDVTTKANNISEVSVTTPLDYTSRLISQVKGVEYLEQQGTTRSTTAPSTGAKTSKKSKYTRRRTYMSKSKRPTRKKITINEKN